MHACPAALARAAQHRAATTTLLGLAEAATTPCPVYTPWPAAAGQSTWRAAASMLTLGAGGKSKPSLPVTGGGPKPARNVSCELPATAGTAAAARMSPSTEPLPTPACLAQLWSICTAWASTAGTAGTTGSIGDAVLAPVWDTAEPGTTGMPMNVAVKLRAGLIQLAALGAAALEPEFDIDEAAGAGCGAAAGGGCAAMLAGLSCTAASACASSACRMLSKFVSC